MTRIDEPLAGSPRRIESWIFVDESARNALITNDTSLDRIAYERETGTYWRLVSAYPIGWELLGSSSGGSGGDGDLNYHHAQNDAQTVWTIVHNLGKYPSVTVLTPDGIVFGDIVYTSVNILTVTFSAAIAGDAYLN